MTKYSFAEFLKSIENMDYSDIFIVAEEAIADARKDKKFKFVDSTKEFLFFLRYGKKPASVSEHDWALYVPVVKNLIKNGGLLPSVIDIFNETATTPEK